MIINENLTHVPPFKLLPINDRNRYQAIEIPTNLVEGDTYTVSAEVEQTSNGTGGVTLRTYDRDIKTMNDEEKCSIGKDGRVHLSFEYNTDKTVNFLFYSDIAMKTDFIGAYFFNIKLENGDQMTPYLPHKSNVKADNQAIFPIGGGITKYSLYRRYKGVSLW